MIVLVERPIQNSIQYPILPGQCNLKQIHHIKVIRPRSCPRGSTDMTRSRYSRVRTCQIVTINKRQCCPGFFGPTCQFHCPGPFGKSCNKNGQCHDGLKGDGSCFCKADFTGDSCEKCTSESAYGPNCNMTCKCLNGQCVSGTIYSSGKCRKCNTGFRGTFCEKKVIHCINSSLICGRNQRCEIDDNEKEHCVCNEGYKKIKTFQCVEHNPCQDPETQFGGCHEKAVCKYLGPGNSICNCSKGYFGDGVVCQKDFGECKAAKDCKTKEAVCNRGKCQCLNGHSYFKGNCTKTYNCRVNNGGCHSQAQCLRVAPDYNSHCKCKQNVPGDGFLCLIKWKLYPYVQSDMTNRKQLGYLWQYEMTLKHRQMMNGRSGPYTIIYAVKHLKTGFVKEKIADSVLNGLYFIKGKNAFQTTDFFYPNSSMWELKTTKKGNDTFLNGAKVIQSNIYVLEGLLHIVEKFPIIPLSTVKVANGTSMELTTQTTARPTPPVPNHAGPPRLMYPLDVRGKMACYPPFQILHVNLTARIASNFGNLSVRIRDWYDFDYKPGEKRIRQTMKFCIVDHTKLRNGSYCMLPLTATWNRPCPTGFFYLTKPLLERWITPRWERLVVSSSIVSSTNNSYWRDYVSNTFNLNTLRRKYWSVCCERRLSDFQFPMSQKSLAFFPLDRCPIVKNTESNLLRYYVFRLRTVIGRLPAPSKPLCEYIKVKIRPTTRPPPTKKFSRVAYLVFNEDDCPKNRSFPMNHTADLIRYPVFGVQTQKTNKVLLCTPKSLKDLPRGYYCTVKLDRYRCPKINGIYTSHKYIKRAYKTRSGPWRYIGMRRYMYRYGKVLHYFCCGRFGNSLTANVKSMPAFTLIRERYCSTILGYRLSQDRLTFKYSIVRSGSFLLRSGVNLCHYSAKTVFSYALPKPISGCEKGFLTGFRVQHLEKNDTVMPLRAIHLAGSFKLNHNIIRLEFCVNIGKPYRFPPGKYCIYRKLGTCPTGFVSSWARIDDEDDVGSTGDVKGSVPDGVYAADSKYFFCCRNDGPATTKIKMPFTKPFYLFKSPHSEVCQKVENFTESHEYLMLDAEDKRVLGKPPVLFNGSVPMTRSYMKGVDVVVHYCYYENRSPSERMNHMGVLQYGERCPNGSQSAKNYLQCPDGKCTKHPFNSCFFNESSTKSLWPKGRYCLVKARGEQCFEDFYKIPIRGLEYQEPLINRLKLEVICCRGTLEKVGSLSLPFLQDFAFGIIAEVCPNIKNMRLSNKILFSTLFSMCYYTPLWPDTLDYALPKVGKDCPPNFHSTTIGELFVKNSMLMNVFSKQNSTPGSRAITSLEVCSTTARKKYDSNEPTPLGPRRSWPAGRYCIFSSDENVVKEFPNIVSYSKEVEKKGWMSVNFIFCRDDGISKFPNGLPVEYLAIPSLSSCPIHSRTEAIVLDDFRNKGYSINYHHWLGKDGMKTPPGFLQSRIKLMACIYKASGDTQTRFATRSSLESRTCKCEHKFASCDDNKICRCNKGFIGDGMQCLLCSCNPYATCSAGHTLWTSSCKCPPGHSGNGLYCKPDPYALGVTVPSVKESDWPRGIFSFLKTYDNIRKCPPGFTIEKSRLVGRSESVAFFTEMESLFCTSANNGEKNWPDGHYCVWSRGSSCPDGLKLVELFLPYRFHQINESDIFVKEIFLDHARMPAIRFCCKSTDNQDQEIVFPPSTFFSLLRKKSKCPKIKSMTSVEQEFYLARGSDEPSTKVINGTSMSIITSTSQNDGPDITWDAKEKSAMIYLCNYYISRKDFFSSICHPSSTQVCQPKKDFYAVMTSNSSAVQVHNIRYILDYCELMDKINEMSHSHVTFFFDVNLVSSMHRREKEGPKNPVCEFVKRSIVSTGMPMSLVLAKMSPGETKRLPSLGSAMSVIKKLNSSTLYTFENVTINVIPVLAAKNGMIFPLQGSLAAPFGQKGKSNGSKVGLAFGLIMTILLVAGLIAFGIYYFKKRNTSSSIPTFVNPVYYRQLEE